ncbi:putative exporter [Elusimicrobium posterum]|uniref:MMPL family transporter n=1 Tax=Elusimicrobium posterum TaxID=3116653 RepID=UPI003C755D00
MNILQKHKKLFLIFFFLFFFLCVYAFTKIKYEENILVMVPAAIEKEVALFQSSPLSKKFFVIVNVDNPAKLDAALNTVALKTKEIEGLKTAAALGPEFILSYYYAAPYLWTAEHEQAILPLLEKENIEEKMQENISYLMGPEGMFLKDFITADPLGMISVLSQDLKDLNITGENLNFRNGFMVSNDGMSAMMMFDMAGGFDRAKSALVTAQVAGLNDFVDFGLQVFSMGAARYTQENNDIIQKDVRNVLILSVVLMLGIFLIFFRDRRALFVYIVPVLVLIPAAVLTFLIFGSISGITIGFGSVLMGLAVDYSVYIYFAIKSAKAQNKNSVIRAMFKPIILSASTSIISFVVIYFCSIELFRQISVFATSGLIYALFLAFVVAPLFFKARDKKEKDFKFSADIKPLAAAITVSAIIFGGIISIKFLSFDTSLDSLNTVSKEFVEQRKIFDSITGNVSETGALLFVSATTQDGARAESEKIAKDNNLQLPLSVLLPSASARKENLERWKTFWTRARINEVKKYISEQANMYGLQPSAFNGFYNFLSSAAAPAGTENFDLTSVYNPFVQNENSFSMVHVLKGAEVKEDLKLGENAVLVSQNLIQKELFYSVIKILFIIMAIVAVLDFIMLWTALKDVRIVILGFIPILCGISMIFIISAIFGFKINLFSLFSIPLIIGLGVDYAIFVIHQSLSSKDLHPSRGVASAALLTLAGFGALVVAKHKVLFAIGFTVSVGIATAVIISIYLLPAMVKHSKKVISLLLIIFLFACGSAGKKVEYNVPANDNLIPAEGLVERRHGELNGQVPFTSVMLEFTNGQKRVIVDNGFGIKFADFSITKDNVEVHSYNFLPKRAVSALGLFYKDFYFNRDSLKKVDDEYSGAGGRIILYDYEYSY